MPSRSQHPRGRALRVMAVACAGLALVAAAGCTVSDVEADSRVAELVEPTGEAGQELQPLTEMPRDSRTVDGPTFTLVVPAAFQQSEAPGPGGVDMLVLQKPAVADGGVVQVIAFDEVEPTAGISEQMAVLGQSKTDLQGVEDFERETIEWPGATGAIVAQWTQQTDTRGGLLTERFVQLALQIDETLLTTVIAVAPEDEFEGSGALEILRSLLPVSAEE